MVGRPDQHVGEDGYSRTMSLDALPAGLPPGRLVTPDPRFSPEWSGGPVCWASQQPLPDAPQQWARLQAIQDRTGLRPILFWPDDAREPCHSSQIDALDAETILLREWHALERHRQQGLYDPEQHRAMLAGIPEDVDVDVPYDPGPPFATWPGLAPPAAVGRDPEVVAREVVGRHLLPRMLTFTQADVYLGLVPAARSADVPALIGWDGPANALWVAELSAVLRSWEQRFGARVVALLDALYVSVAAPPLRWDHAEHLTLEHLLVCLDNLQNMVLPTFPSYVDRILGADLWSFWWD
jgi:Domain of unknown function (DUF4253)